MICCLFPIKGLYFVGFIYLRKGVGIELLKRLTITWYILEHLLWKMQRIEYVGVAVLWPYLVRDLLLEPKNGQLWYDLGLLSEDLAPLNTQSFTPYFEYVEAFFNNSQFFFHVFSILSVAIFCYYLANGLYNFGHVSFKLLSNGFNCLNSCLF